MLTNAVNEQVLSCLHTLMLQTMKIYLSRAFSQLRILQKCYKKKRKKEEKLEKYATNTVTQ